MLTRIQVRFHLPTPDNLPENAMHPVRRPSTHIRFLTDAARVYAQRHGVALLITVVCLVITTGIIASMVQATMLKRSQLAHYQQNIQTSLLIDAGTDLARRQLANDADVTEQRWTVAYESSEDGTVERTITARLLEPDDPGGQRTIEIEVSPSPANRYDEPTRVRFVAKMDDAPHEPRP